MTERRWFDDSALATDVDDGEKNAATAAATTTAAAAKSKVVDWCVDAMKMKGEQNWCAKDDVLNELVCQNEEGQCRYMAL